MGTDEQKDKEKIQGLTLLVMELGPKASVSLNDELIRKLKVGMILSALLFEDINGDDSV